jgi:hypothetical protein
MFPTDGSFEQVLRGAAIPELFEQSLHQCELDFELGALGGSKPWTLALGSLEQCGRARYERGDLYGLRRR